MVSWMLSTLVSEELKKRKGLQWTSLYAVEISKQFVDGKRELGLGLGRYLSFILRSKS